METETPSTVSPCPAALLTHAQPAVTAPSAGELAERLFAAYVVDGGQVRLAGCTLEDQPLMRIAVRAPEARDSSAAVPPAPEDRYFYFDAAGRPIAEEYAARMGLTALEPLVGKPPRVPPGILEGAVEAAVATVARSTPTGQVTEATIVWCKFAAGKLRFTFPALETSVAGAEPRVAELHFADWAALLAAPPFVCPHTQRRSYHVAATDDGRVVVGEEIGVCAQTGRRVLRRELATCAITGKSVLPNYAQTCPVRGEIVLQSVAVPCTVCGQAVSPLALQAGKCLACRSLRKVDKDDPAVARLLGAFPRLDAWRWWRMAETRTSYILVAASVLRRLLIVVDRETLTPSRIAVGHRLLSGWALLRPEQFAAELGPGDATE